MYPMGLTTIAHHLESHGYNVEIVNVAYRMLSDPAYDPERDVARLRPALFGIDLHWLPHAHGALELAALIKRHHPEVPIVFGGLSSSYYHDELVRYPCVDMVMRGDSTEEPMLRLLHAVRFGEPLDEIPNLTWKDAAGEVHTNPLSYVPESLDELPVPSYLYVMRSVLKYGSLANVIPYVDWLSYPITALLTARGCNLNCAVCGGSRTAYGAICNRARPAFRSPEALVRDILQIQEFSRAPVFLVHDIRQGGREYADRLLDLLAAERIENELIFELFFPAGDDFFSRVAKAAPRFSLEMTIESPVEELRRIYGKFACRNEQIESTIGSALEHGANRLDLFFMIGIPRQTYLHCLEAVDYCRRLLELFPGESRLAFFAAPLAPFLDPGSRAFENPEAFGYRLFSRTLEEHRRQLTAPSWKTMLNYESETLSRDDIVDATYETALRLTRLKLEHGLIAPANGAEIIASIEASRFAITEIDRAMLEPEGPQREARLREVRARLSVLAHQEVLGKEALRWPIVRRFPRLVRLVPLLGRLVLTEAQLFLRRLRLLLAHRLRSLRAAPTAAPPP
jgi:B12-binding domain/radical SAM domain protein